MAEPVLEVRGLEKHFSVPFSKGGGRVRAVDGVDFTLEPGRIHGVVGESGCGKSTLARCVMRLLEPTGGTIRLLGQDITHMRRRSLRASRGAMQMVFQDPFSSLNPRMTIRGILSEPLKTHQRSSALEREKEINHLMQLVGLSNQLLDRRPHRLSGGQRQRIALARAISTKPRLLVADEPVSALDVSVRASILNLLRDLHEELNFACLLITHDLSVVEFLCHSVSVMYLGEVVETATTDQLFRYPQHPYTKSLLAATLAGDPAIGGKRVPLKGDVPSPLNPPPGCHFHTRCPIAEFPLCKEEAPVLREVGAPGHEASCHLIGSRG